MTLSALSTGSTVMVSVSPHGDEQVCPADYTHIHHHHVTDQLHNNSKYTRHKICLQSDAEWSPLSLLIDAAQMLPRETFKF